jgi:hypothetical protein
MADIDFGLDETGAPRSIRVQRWGNPEGAAFHYVAFGGFAENEVSFGGYTIPTRLRVGWHFGAERFESVGEFFRATVDSAAYR